MFIKTTSVTELRDNLTNVLKRLEEEKTLMIVRNSKTAAYMITPETMEQILSNLEDYEDLRDAIERLDDVEKGTPLQSLDEIRQQLGL